MDQFSNKSIIDDKYIILTYLDSGTQGKIKLVRDINNPQRKIVIKQLFEDSDPQELQKEFEILQQGVGQNNEGHKNVLRAYDINLQGEKKKKYNRENKPVKYMVIDFAENGCIFDYVKAMGGFHKGFCKFYLRELMEGLKFLHGNGICHRDIKLENILLDDEYVLKIADLGYASQTGVLLNQNLGTRSYKPPEINANQQYQGDKADVFSSGVTFFLMNCCFYPFSKATFNNPNYQNFIQNKQQFWDHQKQQMEQRELDTSIMENQNFIDLMNGMWDENPQTRWTVQQVLDSAYLNEADIIGEGQQININQQLIKHNLSQHKNQVDNERQAEREKQKAENNSMEEEDEPASRAVPEDLVGQINEIKEEYDEQMPEKYDFPVAADMKGLDNAKIQLVLKEQDVIPVIIYILKNIKVDGYVLDEDPIAISKNSAGKVTANFVDSDGDGELLQVSTNVAVQKGQSEEVYNIYDIRIARREGGYVEYRDLVDKFYKESQQFL